MRGVPSSLASRSRAPFHAFEARIAPVRGRSTGPEQRAAQIVAEGRVVDVQPSSAALLVTLATREINVGDRAEMRRGY